MAQDAAGVWVLNSGQWVRHNGSPVNPPPPPPPTGMRFPGDPQPLVTGQTVFGCSVKGGASPAAWESTAGVPLGTRHRYDGGSSDAGPLAWPNGEFANWIAEDHKAGRIPMVGWHLADAQWAAAAGGSLDTQINAWFAGVETTKAPVIWIVDHEPEDGNSTDYKAWTSHIRSLMNTYIGVHGPFKRLVYSACFQAATFAGSHGGINSWYPGDGVFDVMGIDGYAWDSGTTMPSDTMKKAFAFCADHSLPFGIPEYGVRPTDPQGGAKMKNLYNLMTSGSYDCVYMSYFSINGPAWQLNTSNGTLPEFYREMKAPSSVHFRDLGY